MKAGKRIITIVLTAMMIITAMPVIPGGTAGRVYAAGPVGSLNGKTYTSFEKLADDLNSSTYENKEVTIEMLSAWNAAGSSDFDRPLKIPSGCKATLNMHGNVWNRNLAFRGNSKGDGELIVMEDYSTLVINGASNDEEKNKGPYSHIMEYSSSSSGAKANKDTTSTGATMTGGCSSDGGGAITEKDNCTLTINDVSIVGCGTTNGTGGGIYVKGDYTDLRLNYVTIRGCYSDSHGGGIYLNDEPSTLEMNGSVIKNNYAKDDGGGIYTNDETMTITGRNGSMITGNEAGRNGGGVYDYAGEISLSGFEISNNTAKRNGGGVFLDDTKSTVSACTITGNSATENGGGIYVEDNGSSIAGCTITGNKANRSGGGVYVYKNVRENFSISGVTVINDNKANWPGNQLYVSDSVASDTRINFKLAKGSYVAVCYDPDALEGKNSVMVTQGSAGDTIKSPNCIRYLHPSNEGWHFTFNSAANQRKIYYVRDGKDSAGTGEPDTDTQQDPEDVTPQKAINNPGDTGDKSTNKAGIVGKVGKGGGSGSEYNLIRGFSRHQETDGATADTATVFYYSDAFFDADPYKYNEHLATASLNMAYAGMYLHAAEEEDVHGNIYYNRHAAARQFMADIGCPDQNIYVNESNEKRPGTDSIGVTIGSKNLAKANGEETGYILVPIVTRGGGYEREWASNFTLDYARFTQDRQAESSGFSKAADDVMKAVETYINKYDLNDALKQGKVKFWVAGYSRGGATANITAKRLVEKYARGTEGKKNQVFAYTCEAPMGGTDDAEAITDKTKYYCIHNMQNAADIVPLVAPQLMGFKRYGVDHYIPGTEAGTVKSENALSGKFVRSGQQGPRTATTYRDNEISYVKNMKDAPKKAMLEQLRAVDSGIVFDDYFHPMKMGLLPPSVEENGHYDHNHVEAFIRDFMRFAQEGMNPTETDRRTQAIPSRDFYADELQDGLRAIIGSVMVLDKDATEGLVGRIKTIANSFLFLGQLDGANLIMYIQKWGNLSESEKHYWTGYLWKKAYNTGAFDFLSEEDKATFGWYWHDVADLALTLVYADYKYNPEKYNYSDAWAGGVDGTNAFLGTFSSYATYILSNHLPEVNLAWARSFDSYYNNETTEYETLYQDRAVAAGYSVKAPAAFGKEKTEDKKLEEGKNKTNRLSGDQKIILENEDVVGEAVYYDLADTTDEGSPVKMETNLLYRGGVDLTLGKELSRSYTITTYDISYGVRSAKAVYNIRLVNDDHKVTVDNGSGEVPDRNPKDHLYNDNEKVTVAAEPADEKYFKRWKAELLDDKGNTLAEDISDALFADQKNKMTAGFTMPSAGSDKYDGSNVYPERYALKITAVCADKIRHIDAAFAAPEAGQTLADSAKLSFDNEKGGTYPISWTYTTGTGEDSRTVPASGEAYNDTVYTASVTVPQDTAGDIIFASILTGKYTTSTAGMVRSVTRNNADGSAAVVIEFPPTGSKPETYTVRWVDEDGKELHKVEDLEYGADMPVYEGKPSKEASAEYSYEFDRWTADVPAGPKVTGNVTFTACYKATKNKYTIVFENYDKTELQKTEVEYGETPAYKGTVPSRAADASKTYTFAGWDPAIGPVTGNKKYTAVFNENAIKYTFRWVDEDGTELYKAENLEYGDPMPDYKGEKPEKKASAEYSYEFDKWIPDAAVGDTVTRDVTFTASYTATKNRYTIVFENYDKTQLQKTEVEYGKTPAYTGPVPSRASDVSKTYTFAGWDPAIGPVTGNKKYTAVFNENAIKYTFLWVDEDGTELYKAENLEYGADIPDYKGEKPEKVATAEYSYEFDEWIPDSEVGEKVTRDVTFTASYKAAKRAYTISFVNEDGTELQSGEVEYGKIPAYIGDTPVKDATDESTYVFAGWEPAVSAVTGGQTYKATFVPTKNTYTVRWLDDNGTMLDGDLCEYGDPMPDYKGEKPEKKASAEYSYEFDKWIPDAAVGDTVTRDVTFTASYTATKNRYTIVFENYDKTQLQKTEVEYGEKPAYTGEIPSRAADASNTYVFAGWDPVIRPVTGGQIYTAGYDARPKEADIGLTIRAYDLNIKDYDKETADTVLYTMEDTVISLTAPAVNNERFVKWDFRNTGIKLEEGYSPADKSVRVSIPAGLTAKKLDIDAQYIPVINEIAVSVKAPATGTEMQTDAEDGTLKVRISELYEIDPEFVKITWAPAPPDKKGKKMPDYQTAYTATVSIAPKEDEGGRYIKARKAGEEDYTRTTATFYYSEDLTATFNGESVTCDSENNSVSFTFPVTAARKYKLVSVEQPEGVSGLPYGTTAEQVGKMLPKTVMITLDDGSAIDAEVKWSEPSAASKKDDREETFWTAKGTVTLPDNVENTDGISLGVTMQLSAVGADACISPEASLPSAVYTLDQTTTLKTLQPGGVTYYTLDGSDPAGSGTAIEYKDGDEIPISRDDTTHLKDEKMIDENGKEVSTGRKYIELKAVTRKSGMWDSAAAIYRYVFEPAAPALTYVEVNKVWDDREDQDGIRPDSVSVKLYSAVDGAGPTEVKDKDGNPVTLELSDENNWEGLFPSLPEKQGDKAITYSVDEVKTDVITGIDGPGTYKYIVKEAVDKEDVPIGNAFTITNTHTPEMINIEGNIVWNDSDDQDGKRPDQVTIRLFAGKDEKTGEDGLTVKAADGWKFKLENLPKYADGKPIEYSISEDNIDEYTSSISGSAAGSFTVTNEHTPGKTQVNVQKVWLDDFDRDGIRPESVTIKLYVVIGDYDDPDDTAEAKDAEGNPVDPLVLSEDNDWTGSFTGLPAKAAGQDIKYIVEEVRTGVITGKDGEKTYYVDPPHGTMKRGFRIWNIHTPKAIDISGTKIWDDNNDKNGSRPDQIMIRLKADNKEVCSRIVTEADGWKWTFADYPVNEAGKSISYTISEDAVTDYSTEIEGDAAEGFTVTNKYEPGKTRVVVSKVWEDEDDAEEIRPKSVTVKLLAAAGDEEPEEAKDKMGRSLKLKLSANNDWTGEFNNLDTRKDGKYIRYSVQEVETDAITGKDGKGTYADKVSGSAEEGYTVTNTHTVERIAIKGRINWDDSNNAKGTRPDKAVIHLMNGSTVVSTRTVTANDNWQWIFEDVQKYHKGEEIRYSILEDNVTGYTTTINGYTVTNKLISDKPDDPTPEVPIYTITYDLNGGSYNGSTQSITEEYPAGTLIRVHVAPVREGYTFRYWKGSKYQPGDSYTVTEDHTLTAQWKKTSDKGGFSGKSGRGTDTGDSQRVLGWTALFTAGLLAMITTVLIKRRRRG